MSKAKRIWDNCRLIGEVQKTPFTKLVIELVTRDGVKIINIREWYMKRSTNEWKPGINGFGIPIVIPIDDKTMEPIQEVLQLIDEAIDESRDFPIEDEANAVYAKEK